MTIILQGWWVDENDKELFRNNTIEFLIFTAQAGEKSIESRYEGENVWLSQNLMAELFAVNYQVHLRSFEFPRNQKTGSPFRRSGQ